MADMFSSSELAYALRNLPEHMASALQRGAFGSLLTSLERSISGKQSGGMQQDAAGNYHLPPAAGKIGQRPDAYGSTQRLLRAGASLAPNSGLGELSNKIAQIKELIDAIKQFSEMFSNLKLARTSSRALKEMGAPEPSDFGKRAAEANQRAKRPILDALPVDQNRPPAVVRPGAKTMLGSRTAEPKRTQLDTSGSAPLPIEKDRLERHRPTVFQPPVESPDWDEKLKDAKARELAQQQKIRDVREQPQGIGGKTQLRMPKPEAIPSRRRGAKTMLSESGKKILDENAEDARALEASQKRRGRDALLDQHKKVLRNAFPGGYLPAPKVDLPFAKPAQSKPIPHPLGPTYLDDLAKEEESSQRERDSLDKSAARFEKMHQLPKPKLPGKRAQQSHAKRILSGQSHGATLFGEQDENPPEPYRRPGPTPGAIPAFDFGQSAGSMLAFGGSNREASDPAMKEAIEKMAASSEKLAEAVDKLAGQLPADDSADHAAEESLGSSGGGAKHGSSDSHAITTALSKTGKGASGAGVPADDAARAQKCDVLMKLATAVL